LSTNKIILAVAVIGGPILLFINYEWTILFLFAFGAVVGLLKFLTYFHPIVHVAIDIVMILICVSWFLRKISSGSSGRLARTPLDWLIAIFGFICVAQIFNPLSYSYMASIASLKMHIVVIPLYFFGYHLCRTKKQIRKWFLVFTLIGVAIGGYAVIQFLQGPTAISKAIPAASHLVYVNTWRTASGQLYFRPFSTTTNAGGAATWAQCAIPLALALIMFQAVSKRLKLFLSAMIVLLCTAILVSLVRQIVLATLVGFVFLVLLQALFGEIKRGVISILLAGILFFGSFWFATQLAGDAVAHKLGSIIRPIDAYQKTRGYHFRYLPYIMKQFPLGAGLGRVGPATSKFYWELHEDQLRGGPGALSGENYFLAMVSETGIPGLLVILFFYLAILLKGIRIHKGLKDKELQWVSAGILAVLISVFVEWFGASPLLTTPLNLYFWFLAGVLMKLKVLDVNKHEV